MKFIRFVLPALLFVALVSCSTDVEVTEGGENTEVSCAGDCGGGCSCDGDAACDDACSGDKHDGHEGHEDHGDHHGHSH